MVASYTLGLLRAATILNMSIYSWLVPLLVFLDAVVVPIPIFNDNDGALALALDLLTVMLR